ncbi:MAG TPA: heparan-alpha-glucosaminide N-acetyltransferase domain-containing protein, partial [Terriglobia bacterium]|nr:heparan-alpha-glucosaminide N-acetyltransferase domain-containing protein [Terriglobia bacterium]
MNSATPPSPARLGYLDLLRGFFILVMIEGHTLRLFLSPETQETAAFRYQELIHNLTGPVFLFAAGAAFVYSSFPRWEVCRRWSPPLRRRLLRWTGVLVAGYALQLTFPTLRRTLAEGTPEQLAYLLSLNILQCIVYSLLLLQCLLRLAPDQRWFFRATLLGAAVLALPAPLAWDYGRHLPVWLAPLLSGNTRSIFPLFPYAAYAMAGAAWGYRHLLARGRDAEEAYLRQSCWYAAALSAGASLPLLLQPHPASREFWETSPLAFLLRTGGLVFLAAAARLRESRLLPRWQWLAATGEQSLLIYVAHLLILYGSAFNPDTSLRKALGVPLPLAETLLVSLLFGAAMTGLALGWNWWSKNH